MPDSTLSRRSAALHARLAKYPSGNHKIIPRILNFTNSSWALDRSGQIEPIGGSVKAFFSPFRAALRYQAGTGASRARLGEAYERFLGVE